MAVGLLIMRCRLQERFGGFVKKYLKELEKLQEIEERKLRANGNEKSEHYVIEFKRARQAIELFFKGEEMECIEKFFGAHEDSYKEKTYLQDSIDFYNFWREELGLPILNLQNLNVEPLTDVALSAEPAKVSEWAEEEYQMMEIETPNNNNIEDIF